MFPYIITLITAPTLGKISSIKGLRFLWWFFPASFLILFSGMRHFTVGSDTLMYQSFFLYIDPNSLTNSLERIPQESGFITLMFIVRQFTEDPRTFLTVCSALTVFPVLIAIRRVSSMPAFSLFLYIALAYYPVSLNAVRQSIAVSLIFLAETYRQEKRWLWLLLSCIAPLFHVSAVVVIFTLILLRKLNPRLIVILISVVLIASFGMLFLRLGIVVNILGSLNERYTGYLDGEEAAGIGTVLVLITQIIIGVFCIYMAPSRNEIRVLEAPYIGFFLISVAILILTLSNNVIGRFEPYFGIFVILAIPELLKKSRNKSIWLIGFTAFGLIYFMVHITFYNNLIPYAAG